VSTRRTQQFLDDRGTGLTIIEPPDDTSTVETAAAALGVRPAQIAKTLALRAGDDVLLLVTAGDTRLDNRRFRDRFGAKPRLLPAEETEALTGQPVGGVAPFGHPRPLRVFADVSLQRFDIVYPAGGSRSSAIPLAPDQLLALAEAQWVDVTSVR